jgi:transcriptional regulator with XRE-family HTH domain
MEPVMAQRSDSAADHLRDLRRRRGFTQEQLAERADLSLGTVKKVEQGGQARIDTYHALARALDVRTSALFDPAGPHRTRRGDDDKIDLLPLRQAVAPPVGPRGYPASVMVDEDEPDISRLWATARQLARAYHRDRYGEVAELLPALVLGAHAAVEHYRSGAAEESALRLRANVLQMAGRYLTQVRAYDLAHIALRDAVRDAAAVGDMDEVAGAVYQEGWLLIRQGRLDEAEAVSVETAEAVEPRISRATRRGLGGWGKLLVHASSAAARNNRPGEARQMLQLARTAGAALGGSTAVEESSWGRFDWRTVAFQGIENHLVADQPDRVLGLAGRMPPTGRAFARRHLLDVAQAHVMLRQGDEAEVILESLLEETPEWLRHQRLADEVFRGSVRLSKRRRATARQRRLSEFFAAA